MTDARPTEYRCPGEPYTISRSIHLARLAAFYPKCHECPHRVETGALTPRPAAEIAGPPVRRPDELVLPGGVRGTYLNEINRCFARAWAVRVANHLWKDRGPDRPSPLVVTGNDERPTAPDVAAGFVLGLRRMGCRVRDLGTLTGPALACHLQEYDADAAVHVTGAGCGPEGIGWDLWGRGGVPWSAPGTLAGLAAGSDEPLARGDASPGEMTAELPSDRYEPSLAEWFHALRPLKVGCAVGSPLVRPIVERVFARLACRLVVADLPRRARDWSDPRDPDLERVGRLVREQGLDLGCVIDDRGQGAAFVDERGTPLPFATTARLLTAELLRDYPGEAVVCRRERIDSLGTWIVSHGGRCVEGGPTAESLTADMRRHRAPAGVADDHALWFLQDGRLRGDGLITLAMMLKALSRSDAACSAVAERAGGAEGR